MEQKATTILNYSGGTWVASKSAEKLDVVNPATAKTISRVPLSTIDEVDSAVKEASAAYQHWSEFLQLNASNTCSV